MSSQQIKVQSQDFGHMIHSSSLCKWNNNTQKIKIISYLEMNSEIELFNIKIVKYYNSKKLKKVCTSKVYFETKYLALTMIKKQ